MLVANIRMQTYNKASNDQLNDEENADTRTQIRWQAVESGCNIDTSLAKGDDNGEHCNDQQSRASTRSDSQGVELTLLCRLVELAIRLHVEVDINHLNTCKQLEDHASGDDGSDAKLHQCSSVTGKHHPQPV